MKVFTAKILREVVILIIAAVLLFALLIFFLRGYIFNDNHIELARRGVCCVKHMHEIAATLKERQINLDPSNIPQIVEVISELNLWCPSGDKVYSNRTDAYYKVITLSSGDVVITENVDNHDTSKMRYVDLPYRRYCVYQTKDQKKDIEVGYWKDREESFEKIFPYDMSTFRK